MILYDPIVSELTRRLVRATRVMRDVARMLAWYEARVTRLEAERDALIADYAAYVRWVRDTFGGGL
jgi:hypothetical protein